MTYGRGGFPVREKARADGRANAFLERQRDRCGRRSAIVLVHLRRRSEEVRRALDSAPSAVEDLGATPAGRGLEQPPFH